MFRHIFTVKQSKHQPEIEVGLDMPETTDDLEGWYTRVHAKDDDDLKRKINKLALNDFTVKAQAWKRRNWEKDISEYKYDAPVTRGPAVPTIDCSEIEYTEEQVKHFLSKGWRLTNVHELPFDITKIL